MGVLIYQQFAFVDDIIGSISQSPLYINYGLNTVLVLYLICAKIIYWDNTHLS